MSDRESFAVNYNLILHTAKVLYLERFAMHGIFDDNAALQGYSILFSVIVLQKLVFIRKLNASIHRMSQAR